MICGVMLKTGSNTPYRPRNWVSEKRTSSRATSMSLLFCSALRIASFRDIDTTLLLSTPTRVRSGMGGTGWAVCAGKLGSRGGTVNGVGDAWAPGVIVVPGGAVAGGTCVPGGAVGGGVGVGTCASAALVAATIKIVIAISLVSERRD